MQRSIALRIKRRARNFGNLEFLAFVVFRRDAERKIFSAPLGFAARRGNLTESSKSPASIAKSNKQWVGTCLYQEECKLLLVNCGAVIRL